MRVILLQPPIRDFYDTEVRLQPIGLCYLKAAVGKHLPQVEVVVKDFHAGCGRRTAALPSDFQYLRDFYPCRDRSPFSAFSQYRHFGAAYEDIAREVAAAAPGLVGICCLCSTYSEEAVDCARGIKERLDVPIVMGGPHVSALPEEVLSDAAVDFVIRGEGELPLVRLLQALDGSLDLRQVPNLGFKEQGRMIWNPLADNFPIDELPPPDLSDLRKESYRDGSTPLVSITTSRGCPYTCDFCSVARTFGPRYRRRTNASILDEIDRRYSEGYRAFDFEDDNLTFRRPEMKELCLALIEKFPGRDIRLFAMNGLAYFNLDRELLTLMARAGFSHLNLSLVTADPKTAHSHKRPHDLERFLEVVRVGVELGRRITGYQILGLPGEPLDSMADTLAMLARLPLVIGASVFYRAPGCALAGADSWSKKELRAARLTALGVPTAEYDREDLYTLFVAARIFNFLKLVVDGAGGVVPFSDALERAGQKGPRQKLGVELLQTLFSEQRLYAFDGSRFRPLERFRYRLFRRAWDSAGVVQTPRGTLIRTDSGT